MTNLEFLDFDVQTGQRIPTAIMLPEGAVVVGAQYDPAQFTNLWTLTVTVLCEAAAKKHPRYFLAARRYGVEKLQLRGVRELRFIQNYKPADRHHSNTSHPGYDIFEALHQE